MSELQTPYEIRRTSNQGLSSVIIDCNGFCVLDSFGVDADEIIKRINGYEGVVAENVRNVNGSSISIKNERIAFLEQQLAAKQKQLTEALASRDSYKRLLIERDGGSHDTDCERMRSVRGCRCGHDDVLKILDKGLIDE